MTEEKREEKLLQWHAAFFADIQIELEEEAEYKSPDDYLSIDDFFKVYGYACFYKADTGKVNEIKADELTITFVCHGYPRELCNFLVQKRLSKEKNFWLKSLTNDLKEKQEVERLLVEYKEHQADTLYQSVMDIIVNANEERFQVNDMCEALERVVEYHKQRVWKEGNEQGIEQGVKQQLLSQITKKLHKNKSLSQIADELEETEEVIRPLYEQVQQEMGLN